MTRSPKIILLLPLSDGALLAPFVETCLRDGATWIATYGPGCVEVEDLIDWIIIEKPGRFLVTTSHPNETLEEVEGMLAYGEPGPIELVTL
jgi:hypothetical protein